MPRCRNSVAAPTDEQPHIGNYRLLKTIGKGNFAKVKLARHILTGKEVSATATAPGRPRAGGPNGGSGFTWRPPETLLLLLFLLLSEEAVNGAIPVGFRWFTGALTRPQGSRSPLV